MSGTVHASSYTSAGPGSYSSGCIVLLGIVHPVGCLSAQRGYKTSGHITLLGIVHQVGCASARPGYNTSDSTSGEPRISSSARIVQTRLLYHPLRFALEKNLHLFFSPSLRLHVSATVYPFKGYIYKLPTWEKIFTLLFSARHQSRCTLLARSVT